MQKKAKVLWLTGVDTFEPFPCTKTTLFQQLLLKRERLVVYKKAFDTSHARRTNFTANFTTNFMAKWTQTQEKSGRRRKKK